MREVGRFRLVAEIKRGDHIVTYRGFDPQEQRLVIVKLATLPVTAEDPALERLRKEGEIYHRIRHPNIARLIEIGVEGLYPYLVLEFVEGPGLRPLLQQHAPLPQEIALFCMLDLLDGLQHIHRKGLIHRDLKPENLILSLDGRLKICDFDLALEQQKEQPSEGLSGTVGYLSPEALYGERLTPAADLFSAGIIFYEMLTGVRPFKRESAKQEITAIGQQPPVPLRQLNPEAPQALVQIIDRLLEKDPGRRLRSAAEVISRLEQHFDLPMQEERHSRAAAFAQSPPEYERIELREKETPASEKRNRRFALPALALAAAVALLFTYWQLQPGNNASIRTPEATKRMLPADSLMAAADSVNPAAEPVQTAPGATNRAPITTDTSTNELHARVETENEPPAAEKPVQREPAFAGKAVVLHTLPWSAVFVDGDSLGLSTDLDGVFLAAGLHQITFRNPRLPELTLPLEIRADSPDTMTFDLLMHFGQVFLEINPWAYVYVDGREIKNFSSRTPLILPPGSHSIRLLHPALGSVEKQVELAAGEVQKLSINMFQKE